MLALMLVVLGAYSGARAATPSDARTAILHPSWATGYASPTELRDAADLVVVGSSRAIVSEGEDILSPGIAATRIEVDVKRVLKGTADASIVVKQTGGWLGDVLQVVPDDPPMTPGQRFLLYLHRIPSGPYAGDYFVLGGPAGRFSVEADGQLRPFGDVSFASGTTIDMVR